jgi:hypothetical protein
MSDLKFYGQLIAIKICFFAGAVLTYTFFN